MTPTVSSLLPGVCAGAEGAVGVCEHGGGGRELGGGAGGGPDHTQPAGQRQPATVPQQSQPRYETPDNFSVS